MMDHASQTLESLVAVANETSDNKYEIIPLLINE